MKRAVLVLVIALAGASAMQGISASRAAAVFDAEASPLSLEGTQTNNHVIKTAVGNITCKKTKLTGTFQGAQVGVGVFTSEDLTLHPETNECTAFGFAAEVRTAGCDYTFTRTGKDGAGTPIGPIHIVCEAGKKIEIVAIGFCVMEIPPQTPSGHVAYHNEGAGAARDIKMTTTVKGIEYEGTCGNGKLGEAEGTTTLKAFEAGGAQRGTWVT